MSQYKAAMMRLFSGPNNSSTDIVTEIRVPKFALYIRDNFAQDLLDFILPFSWTFLFAVVMNRASFFENLHLTGLGVVAACLANCVPIGGGIVYIPVLMVMGHRMTLSVSFTLATMSVGNGVFGALRWLLKDPEVMVYESYWYTVLPSSVGSVIGILLIPISGARIKRLLFAVFCLLMCFYVIYVVITGQPNTHTSHSAKRTNPPIFRERPIVTIWSWYLIGAVSFAVGLLVVPTIGVGPAMITFLLLQVAGFSNEEAIVTGIVTGGWTCVVPFAIHLLILEDVNIQQWIMVLPGVYFGAKLAPHVHEAVGMTNVMIVFAVFLFATAALFYSML